MEGWSGLHDATRTRMILTKDARKEHLACIRPIDTIKAVTHLVNSGWRVELKGNAAIENRQAT